jgi:hypothetical protein
MARAFDFLARYAAGAFFAGIDLYYLLIRIVRALPIPLYAGVTMLLAGFHEFLGHPVLLSCLSIHDNDAFYVSEYSTEYSTAK